MVEGFIQTMKRREAIRRLASLSAGAAFGQGLGSNAFSLFARPSDSRAGQDLVPRLAPGSPQSPERLALIRAFLEKSAGLEQKFEARTHKSHWTMPYRLFRPTGTAKLPLVMYLHGSGGLGDDNLKQLGLGNIFGTRLWLLPEIQERFPCFVVVPQTDRGWVRYDLNLFAKGEAIIIPGLGDGNRLALEIVDSLLREFPIDRGRIYVTGQSMGGSGVWNMTAHRQKFFAAAVTCCASISLDDAAQSAATPLWAFHGDADRTVPVSASRERIVAVRKTGARPLYTEYAGVDHNSWEWAYTEPALAEWMFAQHRK